jgi:hypothetical protein
MERKYVFPDVIEIIVISFFETAGVTVLSLFFKSVFEHPYANNQEVEEFSLKYVRP